jgi:hypothetical protein
MITIKDYLFSQLHTMTMHIKLLQQHCNVKIPKKPYTLAGFEPEIFCSVGGRDDHYATPPGHQGLPLNIYFQTFFYTAKVSDIAVLKHCLIRVARWFVFKPKNPNLGQF